MGQNNDRYGDRAGKGGGGVKTGNHEGGSPMSDRTGSSGTVAASASSGGSTRQAPAQGAGLLPAPSLPKGGGALRGIGEKFATHPAMGTGALTVPIATSPGRGGFEIALQLGYDSGAG